jgi:hypothetical protein
MYISRYDRLFLPVLIVTGAPVMSPGMSPGAPPTGYTRDRSGWLPAAGS